MYCSQCGKQIPDDAKFCQECGCKTNLSHQESDSKKRINQPDSNKKTRMLSSSSNTSIQSPTITRCKKCGAIYPADMEFCPTCEENNPLVPKSYSDEYEIPNKPVFSKAFLIYEIAASILIFLLFNSTPSLLILEVFCFNVLPATIYLPLFSKRVNDYNLAKTNPEAYYQKLKAEAAKDQSKQRNSPKCPVCNSTNIERITTVDRGFSIAMVGLASGKIGKQYKCKNCKHMW